jgi:hypothetical protein
MAQAPGHEIGDEVAQIAEGMGGEAGQRGEIRQPCATAVTGFLLQFPAGGRFQRFSGILIPGQTGGKFDARTSGGLLATLVGPQNAGRADKMFMNLVAFTDSQARTFWMRGCIMDLDIAFIDPFGFVTAVVTPEMRVIAFEAGASFFVSKPFTADAMQSAMQRCEAKSIQSVLVSFRKC